MPDPTAPVTADDRYPLDALAEVDCNHTRHYTMCTQCAADAMRPELERLRKAVEDAPKVVEWIGLCVECGEQIDDGDRITWRLRWSPQGPVHEECR